MKERRVVYAVELATKIRDGMIEVPEVHRKRFTDNVRVILLLEEEATQEDDDTIAALLAQPLSVPDFTPLTCEEAHTRSWRGPLLRRSQRHRRPPIPIAVLRGKESPRP
ncbi:MAG: hypothetical protein PVH62_06805 [Anaerolineae bacterium]|jgi:hypothetical protein